MNFRYLCNHSSNHIICSNLSRSVLFRSTGLWTCVGASITQYSLHEHWTHPWRGSFVKIDGPPHRIVGTGGLPSSTVLLNLVESNIGWLNPILKFQFYAIPVILSFFFIYHVAHCQLHHLLKFQCQVFGDKIIQFFRNFIKFDEILSLDIQAYVCTCNWSTEIKELLQVFLLL